MTLDEKLLDTALCRTLTTITDTVVKTSVALAAMRAARADQKERDAKVCEDAIASGYPHDPARQDAFYAGTAECAAAIRAGEDKP